MFSEDVCSASPPHHTHTFQSHKTSSLAAKNQLALLWSSKLPPSTAATPKSPLSSQSLIPLCDIVTSAAINT